MMYGGLILALIVCAFALGHFIGFKSGVEYEEVDEEYNDNTTEQLNYYDHSGNKLDFTNHINVIIEFCEKEKQYFVYCAETHKFIVNGKTTEELENKIRERFPNTLCNVSEENYNQIGL